jgi:hypothetical protein
MMERYVQPPSQVRSWVRGLLSPRKSFHAGQEVPRLASLLTSRRPALAQVQAYRCLCGFADDGALPLTYPQVLAGPLHVALFTDPKFPLAAMGAVHVRNEIVQRRPLRQDEPLELSTWLEAVREVPAGVEADVMTVASVDGDEVWRSTLTALQRRGAGRKSGTGTGPRSMPMLPPPLRSVVLRVPEDMGRRYAAVAGDWNPIHQTAITAKLFGFPRAIAHGMWTLARGVAEAMDDVPRDAPITCSVAFKRPVLLPSSVVLRAHRDASGVVLRLQSPDGGTLHYEANLTSG